MIPVYLCQTSETCWLPKDILLHLKLYFNGSKIIRFLPSSVMFTTTKKCLIWHQFFTKLFSPVARESAWQKYDYHALLPQLQSTGSPSAAALTPHPISVQAGLCLQLLAFSLHTQTTSRRTGHKSEHRPRSVAWISEADLLVSELPDIHHKHNTAESHRFELSLLSSGKDCFSLRGTMNGKCNQDVGDNK